MGKLQIWGATWGSLLILSAIGCSDEGESGDGDGDSNQTGSGGFVTNSGGTSTGDGDALDPCFGELVYCTSGCIDLTSDDENCGRCGERCDADELCEESICVAQPESSLGGNGGSTEFGGGAGSGN